jgi:hypothetical protein
VAGAASECAFPLDADLHVEVEPDRIWFAILAGQSLKGAHDFAISGPGEVAPYGVYDIAANTGWISLGIIHRTAAFAVKSIRRWWQEPGQARYSRAQQLLITADCGGSNGAQVGRGVEHDVPASERKRSGLRAVLGLDKMSM